MSSTRLEATNPESHIATLDAVSVEVLLSMYGPQVRAMKQDVSKGYFYWPDLLSAFFEQYSRQPVLETEKMLRFGLLERPADGSGIVDNSVRISIPILRNWPAVQARAYALTQNGERIRANPARPSAAALKLDFGQAALPTMTLPAPDQNQFEINILGDDAMESSRPATAVSQPATPRLDASGPSQGAVGAITDDDEGLPPSIAERRREFEEQLNQVPRTGAADGLPQTADDVARITGKARTTDKRIPDSSRVKGKARA